MKIIIKMIVYKKGRAWKDATYSKIDIVGDFAAGMGKKGYTSRPKFPEKKLRFFREISASQGTSNFVKTEKEQENPDSSSRSS